MLPAAAGTAAVADPEAGGVVVVAVDRSREAAGAADLQTKKEKESRNIAAVCLERRRADRMHVG